MTWGVVAAGIGAAGAVAGAAISADAAGDAADAQAGASRDAMGTQQRQFEVNQGNQRGFMETGMAANKRLANLLGLSSKNYGGRVELDGEVFRDSEALRDRFLNDYRRITGTTPNADYYPLVDRIIERANYLDPLTDGGDLTRRFSQSDLDSDPVYQSGLKFGAEEGRNAINQRATQMGNYDSGATLKALVRFGNDYGSTKANESFNRFNAENTNIFNRLAGVSGAGQTAANSVNASGSNAANNISQLQAGMGNAQAAGIVGGANAWGSGLQNLNSVYNNYRQNKLFESMFPNAGGQQGYNTDGRDY